MFRIKKNDTVMVTTGKDKGKTGQVIELDLKHDRVKVRGIAIVVRHVKAKREGEVSSIKKEEGYVHISNVMPIVPSTGKPTRVKIKQLENGQKERISTGTNEVL
jgi:large subunit ribosomal protein L24